MLCGVRPTRHRVLPVTLMIEVIRGFGIEEDFREVVIWSEC